MTERTNQAVDRLAAALHELAYQGRTSITPDVRMLLSPGQPTTEDARHLHAIGLSAEIVELLAEAVEKLTADRGLYDAVSEVAQHIQMGRAVDAVFTAPDLNRITKAVLNETAPQDRAAVTHALDAMFGDIPTEDDQQEDGDES
ncbi:hypothetical protein [Streptomyces sp. NBC_00847]|uniref:hypothetical protein n=1 Tax=Streptomyces sp. NBC_00847 TaxID=2975850 RepID=UPI00225E6F48|nr:hypothetical protein [Streptomyces sp. NBC_00847]MCX4886079.1 hypothetical protein [Streptomyces sp. NBC_00847]